MCRCETRADEPVPAGSARLLAHRAPGRHHHPGAHRGTGGPPPVRPRGPEQAGGGPGADRAVRRRAGPVPAGHRQLSARDGRTAGPCPKSKRGKLERAVSQEAGGAARSVGTPVPIQVLSGGSQRLRHLDSGRRRHSRRRRREPRRDLVGGPMTGSRAGYTLMELAVLAIATALVAPAVGRTAEDVAARAQVASVAAFLRGAREQAVTSRQTVEVRVDRDAHALLLRRAAREGEDTPPARRAFAAALRVESATTP